MRFLSLSFFTLLTITITSCGNKNASDYPNSAEGVKKLASLFLKGGTEADAMLKNLKPSLEDCKAIVANEADAKKLADTYEQMYAQVKGSDIAPSKSTQTEILVFHSNTKSLKENTDQELPGGYTTNAEKFKDGLEIYGFKFVEPGQTIGMSFDGLYFVNNKWVLLPKTWKYLE